MFRLPLACAAFALAVSAGVSASAHCAIEHARYALRHDRSVVAGFTVIPGEPRTLSKLAFHVDFANRDQPFWWFFDRGSARYISMLATNDPRTKGWSPERSQLHTRPMTAWFAGADYDFKYDLPNPGQDAPKHIFIPEFEDLMWYGVDDKDRRDVPVGLFDLVACR
jgi:hypothetical protein